MSMSSARGRQDGQNGDGGGLAKPFPVTSGIVVRLNQAVIRQMLN